MPPPNELLHQLLRDESFAAWVHRTDTAAVTRWDTWVAEHPEHRETVDQAARMLRGIAFAPRQVPEWQILREWTRLREQLPELGHASPSAPRRAWLRAAAVGLIVLLAGALTWWVGLRSAHNTIYATSYGETRDFQLPDGSYVTLNAHSRLVYHAATSAEPVRWVELTGEAFFDVVHRAGASPVPFVVRTPDLHVRVLGTEFNVNTRRGRTQVVLDEGQVELQLPSEQRAAMQPGELVEYEAESNQVHRTTVDTDLFIAWRDRRLKFDDTPLGEVAQRLEENYGVTIRFEDARLRHKRVTGEVSARELDTILRALSKLFDITIQRSGDTVRIAEPRVSS